MASSKGGLGLRRRAVDFVGQDDIAEDRPLRKSRRAVRCRVFFNDVGAR